MWSDECSSQFRSKHVFGLMTHFDKSVQLEWQYNEAQHGKGPGYLSNLTHRTKIKEWFSERTRIEHGVPQGSILGPLLFNIDLIDLFYECEETNIASYADDTTQYL